MGYVYIALTVAFTVYGQLAMKWRLSQLGPLPEPLGEKLLRSLVLLADPIIFSAFAAAFLGALAWMAALSKLDLSHAYPFMSSAFVLVIALSALWLGEPLTWPKMVGIGLIVAGIIVGSQG